MGTNYYHHRDVCAHCQRPGDIVHIGKASAGWVFSWYATETERSCKEWYTALAAGGRIVNEYGEEVTLDDFRAMVEARRRQPHHHAREYPADGYEDADGCSFTTREFS